MSSNKPIMSLTLPSVAWDCVQGPSFAAPMQEIDYKLEGQNADRFRKNFADSPWIKVCACAS